MQKTQKNPTQTFDASNWKVGVVVAKFNSHITEKSLQSLIARAGDYGIGEDSIEVIEVAGSVEIPLVLQRMAKTGKYRALVALGCVIRGETAHFDYVCKFVTEGVLRVQLDEQIPIGFGVLMCDTEKQALERSHLGGEHLDAVLNQAKSLEQI